MNNRFSTPDNNELKRSTSSDYFKSSNKLSQLQEQRMRNYNQLQNFYMPILRKAYEQYKPKISTLKPPEELLYNSKRFELKQEENKRKIQSLQKENENKQMKIRELTQKTSKLITKIKNLNPNENIDVSLPNNFEESENKIRRLENLLRIRGEQTFFRLKFKAIHLLEEFEVDRKELDEINKLVNQSGVFEFLINKLKEKVKVIKIKQKNLNDQIMRQKAEHERSKEAIKFLNESNDMIKNTQKRLREKNEELKREWSLTSQRLIWRERENQERENQIFKLNKLIEEKQNQILKSNNTTYTSIAEVEQQKRQLQLQIRQFRLLINNITMEKNGLLEALEEKQNQIESNRIKDRYNQQEYQRINREYIRWKERYEGLEKQKDTKSTAYKSQNSKLQAENGKQKQQIEKLSEIVYNLQFQNDEIKKQGQKIRAEIERKELQNKQLLEKNSQLQEIKTTKILEIEQTYIQKFNQLQRLRQESIKEIMIQKQQEFKERVSVLNELWQKKLEQVEKNFTAKYNLQLSSQSRSYEQFQKLQQENKLLNERLNENQKLLAALYPNIKVIRSGEQITRRYEITKIDKPNDRSNVLLVGQQNHPSVTVVNSNLNYHRTLSVAPFLEQGLVDNPKQ